MPWTEIRIETDSAHAEALSDALMEAGALSASIEDAKGGAFAENDADASGSARELVVDEPGFALPLWSNCAVLALFDTPAQAQQALQHASAQMRVTPNQYSSRSVEEQDWVSITQSQFPPIAISKRLWVVPSWHAPPQPDAINLLLDPGQAFGTGSHPTTKLCLQWLDEHLAPGAALLDYGCGSGILAVAAAKLGAARVVGIDIDARAVATARANAARNGLVTEENAGRNGVQAQFFAADTPLDEARHGRFDVCVANILASPLKVLSPLIARVTKPGGAIVLSGILQQQADEVAYAYAQWAQLAVFRRDQEWVCLAGKRNERT